MGKIKKITFILGTRPQIIKSQPVIDELTNQRFEVNIINTGQHYDYNLSGVFLKKSKIPTINLNIGEGTQLTQISKIIVKLEKLLNKINPDLIFIPGDTTSAIAAAIAASKCKIRIAHLEAGARSNQFYMAEEINRRIIDHCSNILLAPTKKCLENLQSESVFGKAYFVGDTMYDRFLNWRKNTELIKDKHSRKRILITIHRAENIYDEKNLKKICVVINNLQKKYEVIFPIHPNTRKHILKKKFKIKTKLTSPQNYDELMKTVYNVDLVITDSGGLQKEAYWMKKPCITIRESTEWNETIEEQANFLMPLSKPFRYDKIEEIMRIKLNSKKNLYGNGKAAKHICEIITKIKRDNF